MKDELVFLDTNIILYCYAQDDDFKRTIALDVAGAFNTYLSTQVIKETCNILRKKFKLAWSDIESVVNEITINNTIIQIDVLTLQKAIFLAKRYQLQWFDSIIVASALQSNCSILYSEDLQDGMTIENLKIINPFVAAKKE